MIHIFKILALLGSFYSIQMQAQESKTADVVVKVSGIESDEGSIQIAMFSTEESFPDQKPFKALSYTLKGSEKEVEITFKDIPFGEYALAVYHDKNENNELDTNFVGIPKEPYGFSNDHNPKMSAPEFASAKVEINQAQQILNVRID